MVCSTVPLKYTSKLLCRNEPLFSQSPSRVMVRLICTVAPLLMVR